MHRPSCHMLVRAISFEFLYNCPVDSARTDMLAFYFYLLWKVGNLLDKFVPDDILTSDSYPWSFFNDAVGDDETTPMIPEPLPMHGTLENFKQ